MLPLDALTGTIVLAVGLAIVALGIVLLVLGRRRGPDGGAGSAMLAFGITALLLGTMAAAPAFFLLALLVVRTA